MSKKITVGTMLLILLLTVLVTFNVTYLAVNNKYSDKLADVMADYDAYNKLTGIMRLVKENYIGTVDEQATQDAMLAGYIAGIGDKYARYMSAEAYAAFSEEQNASKVGIGVLVEHDAERGAMLVVMVMPDSPAEQVGIRPGDLIVTIGETEVSDVSYQAASDLLSGEAGTTVELTVIRDESRRMNYTVSRAAVTFLSVNSYLYTTEAGAPTDIGYVHISGFDAQTPTQFAGALIDLKSQGATKFIFDLRGNPGGELGSVVKVIDSLLPKGPLVRICGKDGKEEVTNSDEAWTDARVCVLVDKMTASAGELFTAALMDYTDQGKYDATVIGVGTYGKGTVQSIYRLDDNSAIAISTKLYKPPYSDNYEGIGLTPDIALALDEEAAKTNIYLRSAYEDNQIQKAVEILSENKQ